MQPERGGLRGSWLGDMDFDLAQASVHFVPRFLCAATVDREKLRTINNLENAFLGLKSSPSGHPPSRRAITIGCRARRSCSRLLSYCA